MIIDKNTGDVHTDELIITPHFTREELLSTFNHLVVDTHRNSLTRDDVLIKLTEMSKRPLLMFVGLWFIDQKLTRVSLNLYTQDYDRKATATAWYLSKLLNDSIVRADLGEPHESIVDGYIIEGGERVRNLEYHFDWGGVYSYFDYIGGGVGITVSYK